MSDEESFVILGNCSPMHSFEIDREYSTESSKPMLQEKDDVATVQSEMADALTKVTHSFDDMVLSGETVKSIQTSSNGGQDMVCSSGTMEDVQTSSSSSNDKQDKDCSGVTMKGNLMSSGSSNGGQSMISRFQAVTSNKHDIERSAEISRSMQASSIGNSDGHAADKVIQASSSNGQLSSVNKSLAASFILGEIPADVLKSSVYSQFPSVCNSIQSCPEEFLKLQCFWDQYIHFKDVTSKLNSIAKDLQSQIVAVRKENSELKRNASSHIDAISELKSMTNGLESQVVALRNENMELSRNASSNNDQIEIWEKIRQTDHTNLLQTISEKTSQISNMQNHIEKLEQQQLASYEFISKHENDAKNKPDYVERCEHLRIVNDMNMKMSKLLADNLSSLDMEKQYIDEINCLKVNLTAAEELINKNCAEISLLKAKDIDTTQEIALLRQQIDAYSEDFKMERNARESIAGEKDQLLQDLRALQRKNQELIEEAQKQWESIEKCTASAANIRSGQNTASVNAAITNAALYERNSPQRPIRELPQSSGSSNSNMQSPSYDTHRCPVCFKAYKSLTLLQSHVNSCLDAAKK